MKARSFFRLLWTSMLCCCFWMPTTAQVDLELNLSANPLVPEAFKNYTFTLTLQNQGPQTATNVRVDLPLPTGFIYQGGNEYTASQGTYDIFFERIWNVGTLAANATATIDLNLYSLQSTNLYYYGQVIGVDQSDTDSTPANGTCADAPTNCTANEDDEALVLLSNAGTCSLTATVQNTACLDPGNTPDPLDDRWTFDLIVTADNAPSTGWQTFSQGLNGLTGTFDASRSVGDFLISDGPLEFVIQDQQNNACQTTLTVTPPIPCSNSNCSIEVQTTTPICSDSGTPNDPTDDGFQFILVANGINTAGNQYRVQLINNLGTDNFIVNYGEDLLISKFIGDGPVQIFLSDLADPSCIRSLTVNPTAPCSVGSGGDMDLELSLTTTNSNPAIYTTSTFLLQLQNTGTVAATEVQVDFPSLATLAYVSHTASTGQFSNWIGLWDVGTVGPGERVDLEVTLFTLSSDPINLFAQVNTHVENDRDSTPGNGQCCTANEDDEAVLVLNGGSPPSTCTLNALDPTLTCTDNGTSDPSDDLFSFSINPGGSNLGASYQLSGGGLALNGLVYGQSYTSPLLPISNGSFELTVSDVSGNCSQQVTIVPPAPCSPTGPSPGADISIAISASQPSFNAWQILSITLTVSNTGTETATGLAMSFPLPEGTVFTGGNEYVATQGVYQSFFEEWEIGTLAPGGSAGIQFNLFTTQNNDPIVAYAQILRMNENDVDSSPGNGLCCTANEDDEAVLTLAPLLSRQSESFQTARPVLRKAYPNPAIEELTTVVESALARVETLYLYDSRGQIQAQQTLGLEAGVNWVSWPVASLARGIYFVHLPNGQHRSNWLKVVLID